jgi:protein-S-isoprenylcysteine O-methyltransferase Ste14
MITDDRHLLVRAAALYITVLLTLAVWIFREKGSGGVLPPARQNPSRPLLAGAVLAFAWNLPVLLLLNVAAQRYGWWHFNAEGGLLLGVPVDFLLAWAWLWSVVTLLAFPTVSLAAVVPLALAFDLVLMPAGAPVLQLGPNWLIGEAAGLVAGLVIGQLFARWTMRDERLVTRATMQVLTFSGIMLFVLPAIIVEATGGLATRQFERPLWQISALAQLLAIPGILGLSAVQEFVTRGGGTPVPFDPPKHLVTSGIYAYVRNPMQLSAVLLLILLGAVMQNAWVAAAGLMAHIYSMGLAGWDEDDDLRQRFGTAWTAYRNGVRSWMPRVRPWHPRDRPDAVLFVAASCDTCSEVGRWFRQRGACGLAIAAAEHHPSRALTRITYESSDGTYSASGIEAVARAMEHVHLGWALLGGFLRLPAVRQMAQLLIDASGGEPRRIPRVTEASCK